MQGRSSGNAQGIDVSHHNGPIDWAQVAANGYTFAFIKASEGTRFRDPRFQQNVQGASEAGLLVGAYHFFKASSEREAKEEASFFAATIRSATPPSPPSPPSSTPHMTRALTLPPVLDYENNSHGLSSTSITQLALTFLNQLEIELGMKPILYTGNAFSNHFERSLSRYALWIARYGSKTPVDAPAWNRWKLWQYSETGQVSGVTGKTDLNEFDGTLQELSQWALEYMKCRQEEDKDMAALEELQKQIEQLRGDAAEQNRRIAALEAIVNVSGNQSPPAWANTAIEAAKAAGAITTSADKGRAELIGLQVLYNLGLLKPKGQEQ